MCRSGWKLPYGAQLADNAGARGTRFRVAAPGRSTVEVAIAQPGGYSFFQLEPEDDGNFSRFLAGIGTGTRYKFRLDGDLLVPDPYTRSQPDDVHGDSAVLDPTAYEWGDEAWRGRKLSEMIIYELHVGAFTPQGSFDAVIDQLDYLLDLGINTIELMPVGEFPGKRNWGYDGVQYFAPDAVYGGPDGLKRLIDRAHQRGLAVILDVVYNHFGPDGNYLWSYSRDYFTARHKTPWGDAPNYDGVHRELMRTYVLQNALFWAHEYHADGLRLDATFAMIDESERHILKEIAHALHNNSEGNLPRTVIAEDHRNLASLNWPEPEGYGIDGQWVDDLHHTIHCYFTREHDGYYENYQGTIDQIVKTFNDGFLYQGERYATWNRPRGTPPERLRGEEMVVCIQNHDQVGNRALGERLNHLVDRDAYHLAVALLLLSPYTPLLFMGQEYAAKQPFLFFTDHNEELGRAVTAGRRKEFKKFSAFSSSKQRAKIPDPQAESTFLSSKLDFSDHNHEPGVWTFRLHKRLLAFIQSRRALALRDRSLAYTFSPAPDILTILRRADDTAHEDYLVMANLSPNNARLELASLAPYLERARWPDWHVPLLSTLAPDYGGSGALPEHLQDGANLLILPARGLFLYVLDK